jgi:hypothetical protein
MQPVVDSMSLNLRFTADRIHGYGGCNEISGSYYADHEGRLSLMNISMTERYCFVGNSEQEQHYVRSLGVVTTYDVDDQNLRLMDGSGRIVLSFETGCPYMESEARVRAMEKTRNEGLRWGEPVLTRYSRGTYYFEFATPGNERSLLGPRAVRLDCSTGETEIQPRY